MAKGKHVAAKSGAVKSDKSAKKAKGGKGRKAGVIICVIVLVIIAIIAAIFGVANHYLGKMNKLDANDIVAVDKTLAQQMVEKFKDEEESSDDTEGLESISSDDVEWDEIEALNDDDLINIMLVGQDTRVPGERGRTDSMILVSLNPKTQKASMISFMRDTYIQIPNYFPQRLNVPYVLGGFPLMEETMMANFGISIDGFFEVDFEAFAKVIDLIGGVDIEVTEMECWAITNTVNRSLTPLSPGMNHLDGEHALAYCRIRQIDSDYNRTGRQRTVMMAALDKIRDLSMTEMLKLMDDILPTVATTFSNAELMSLATKCFPMLSSLEFDSYRIPADEDHYMTMVDGMSVLMPNLPAIREHLETEYLPLG